MEWIKCVPGQMPEDDERYKDKKVINVIATTNKGVVTKVQRIFNNYANTWYWGRICGGMRAWMSLPDPYKEEH